MRIQSIEATNFKSLVEFKLDLAKFNCLVGLNGTGKSIVLQFIDFMSQLARGGMKAWLDERHWEATELKSKLRSEETIEFTVHFVNADDTPAGYWNATFNPSSNQCTVERLDLVDVLMVVSRDTVEITDRFNGNGKAKVYEIAFAYEGSILSALKEELLPPPILECKRFLYEIKSLVLTPEYLRQRMKELSGTLGLGGQHLASFLHEMPEPRRQELSAMTTEARHVSDGMLRLMAILAELHTKDRFVLFDEIENGINPELIEFVIDNLVNAKQQVLVTTHSPMILNYLDDETAKNGVIYLYKTPQGHTKAIPFFSIPSLAKKLTVMGPGEAFVDTNLPQLADEIAGLNGEEV